MAMRTAALGLLVELNCQVTPKQIAVSFDTDENMVQKWFDWLVEMGYANKYNGMYEASKKGRQAVCSIIEVDAKAD